MLFRNMDSSKLGKKSNLLMLLKKLEVHYIILKSNRLMLLDIHIQIKIYILLKLKYFNLLFDNIDNS